MKPLLLLLPCAGFALAQVPSSVVRPDFLNISAPGQTGGVVMLQGHIANGTNFTIPSGGGMQLREAAFGQPASMFRTPYQAFGNDVLFSGFNGHTAVYSILYPAGYGTPAGVSGPRTALANPATGGVFRYKWLMYGDAPGDGTPAILNLFEQTFGDTADGANPWFNDTDRTKAKEQITVLREALAFSPLDRNLQAALLDIYYDLAVVEMQFARKRLARLASVRLGLTDGGTFIVDTEIATYRELLTLTNRVLACYRELLTLPMAGFDPGNVDPSAAGAPFGWWIFQREVPRRSQTPTQYATDTNAPVEYVIDPGTDNTFSGYRDYRTLLTILGQHIQYSADLARLLGMRRASGDITEARNLLSTAQGPLAEDFRSLRRMFAGVNFDDPQLDATGVRGAITLVESAMNDCVNVRGFLNGTANILGLDPNFLILLPGGSVPGKFDTYDILATKLLETSPNGTGSGPLSVALKALGDPNNPNTSGGAVQAYSTFRESVDKVSEQLAGLEGDYAARFQAITGYAPGSPSWNGVNPNPAPGAEGELRTVLGNIESLQRQNATLGQLTLKLLDDIRTANEAVSLADGIDDTITGAQATYLNKASAAWTELHVWAGAAAGAQALADTAFAVTGIMGGVGSDPVSIATAGSNSVVAGAAGVANGLVQTAAATRTSMRQQELEEAAMGFETTLALAELPLTVKQAQLEAAALMREAYSNRFEIEANFTALAQARADEATLRREIDQISQDLAAGRSALAKRYYADPIHYVRAERELLKADAAFREAQRWTFFTCRALEYKWQERFSQADAAIGATFDIGTILSARNAIELETIMQKMALFDLAHTPVANPDTTTISFRDHILTPNPKDVNLTFPNNPPAALADPGLRFDAVTGATVSRQEMFRRILRRMRDASTDGRIVISFDTTKLQHLPGFFNGPDYGGLPIVSGDYLDKIKQVSFAIVGQGAAYSALPNTNRKASGTLSYGGLTYFRTRVPPCPNRLASQSFAAATDFPGEFIVAPMRYWESATFNGQFQLFPEQSVLLNLAMISTSPGDSAVRNELLNAAAGWVRNDLSERSVAATRWTLTINANQADIETIDDIYLLITHTKRTRAQVVCPP